MTENTTYMPAIADRPVFTAPETQNTNSPRIQVSCINEDEELFLSPRPFSFSKREESARKKIFQIKRANTIRNADDLIDCTVKYVRRIGYALILASVLLLALDGILRNTLVF